MREMKDELRTSLVDWKLRFLPHRASASHMVAAARRMFC